MGFPTQQDVDSLVKEKRVGIQAPGLEHQENAPKNASTGRARATGVPEP